MALQVWLQFTKDINNYGLSDTTVSKETNVSLIDGGKLGKCISASTNSNHSVTVTIDNLATMLAIGKKYTLACWVKLVNSSADSWVVKLGTNQCGLWRGASNGSQRWAWNENDDGKRCADNTTSADIGNWHHLVTVVDKTVSGKCTAYHYVDGVPAVGYESQTWNISSTQPAGTTITIYPYVAQLNDIRLYDNALSEREIKELSKALAVHYPLSRGKNNILVGTFDMETGWQIGSAATRTAAADSFARCTLIGTTANWNSYIRSAIIPYSNVRNQQVTFSFYAKASTSCESIIDWNLTTAAAPNTRTKYHDDKITIGTEWKRYTLTKTINDSFFDHEDSTSVITPETDNFRIRIYNHVDSTILYTYGWKLENGSLATPWKPNFVDSQYTAMGWNRTTEYDCSGYSYNAQIVGTVGASIDTPRYITSATFSGTGTIDCGHEFNIQQAKNITFCCWVKANDWTSEGTKYFISSQEAGGILLGYNPSNGYIFGRVSIYTDSAHTTRAYFTAQTATHKTLSGWHFFTCTYDGKNSGANVVKLYLDGVKINENTIEGYGLQFNDSANLYIGAESAGTTYSNAFSGKISDVRLYYTTLSDEDILELYNISASISNNGVMLANQFVE